MRKQDRINRQQSQDAPDAARDRQQAQPSPQPHPDEKVTGKSRDDQPSRAPHPAGKLPLPE